MNITLILTTFVSLGLAGAMSFVAWRVVELDRRRSNARVAHLVADMGDDEVPPPVMIPSPLASMASGAGLKGGDMFAVDRGTARSRMPIAVAAGGLIVGTVIMLAVVLSNSQSPAASTLTPRPALALAPTPAGAPIELVALTHERKEDGFIVRGVVHNPGTGKEVSHLTAVVLIFDAAGALVTTARAAVDAGDLKPGSEAHFVVGVQGATAVARYRVSFRTDDVVVPHLDKRNGA